jgi:type II secretory pathway component GspD/PulD (secretin)
MNIFLSMQSRKPLALILTCMVIVTILTFAAYSSRTVEAIEVNAKMLEKDIDTLVSNLPILPEENASRPFDTTLKISGLPVAKFLSLLSRPPFLDMNLVIATNSKNLEQPFDVALSNITVGELFNLVLQLNGLKAVRFNAKTLIIVAADDQQGYGMKQRRTYQLRYFLPTKFLDFIAENEFLKKFFAKTNFIPNDVQKNMLVVGSPDKLVLVDYVVNLLDQKPNKIHAQIPLSNIEFDTLKSALEEMLPEDIATTFQAERWVYSETGRCIMLYDDPVTVEVLRKLVENIDIAPKQVLIDIALLEVSSNFSREIGMKLLNSSFSIDSLDKLFSLSRLSSSLAEANPAATAVSYLLQQSGGRALASPKIRVLDGESADINIGQIRNIRIQSTEFNASVGGSSQQTTYNTQEVPIGVQVNVEPVIHNDGTVTLTLAISDEAILEVQDYGIDRTTRNSSTILRIRDGETVIMGGFISQNRDWDKTPIPILGNLPLIGRLFQGGKRTKLDSELVFLITPYILAYGNDEKSIKPKTVGDLQKGNFSESLDGGSGPASTTTKWLEDAINKTKIVIDKEGKVIYKQTWSKETGTPVGDSKSLTSQSFNDGATDFSAFKENVDIEKNKTLANARAVPKLSREEYERIRLEAIAKTKAEQSENTPADLTIPASPSFSTQPVMNATVPATKEAMPSTRSNGEVPSQTDSSDENESWGGMLNNLDDLLVNKGS